MENLLAFETLLSYWLTVLYSTEGSDQSQQEKSGIFHIQPDRQTDRQCLDTDTELVWNISLQVSSKRENMRTTQPEGLSCSTEEGLMLLSKQRREILVSLPAGLEPAGKLNPILVISQAEKTGSKIISNYQQTNPTTTTLDYTGLHSLPEWCTAHY